MSVLTYEAVIEQGQIRLPAHVILPEHTKVYVVVPQAAVQTIKRIVSPQLVHPQQIHDFAMEMREDGDDASV